MAKSLRSLHEAINQISGPTIQEFSIPPELRQKAKTIGHKINNVVDKVMDPPGAEQRKAAHIAKKNPKKYDYTQDLIGCQEASIYKDSPAVIKQIKVGIIDGDDIPSEDFLQDFSEWQDVVTIEGATVKGRTIYFDLHFGASAGQQKELQADLQAAWDEFCDLEYGPAEQDGMAEAVDGENRYRAALVNRVGAILDWLNDPDSSISQDSYHNIEPHVNAIENLINDSGDLDEAAEVDMGQLERIAKNTIGVSFQPGDKEAVVSMGNVKAALANAFRSGAKSTMEGVEGPGSKLIQPEVDRIVGNTFGKVGEKFSTTGNTIKAALLQAYQAGRKSIKSMRA